MVQTLILKNYGLGDCQCLKKPEWEPIQQVGLEEKASSGVSNPSVECGEKNPAVPVSVPAVGDAQVIVDSFIDTEEDRYLEYVLKR